MLSQSINIKWDITNKCNLRCAHCLNGERLGNLNQELSLTEVKSIIKEISHYKIGNVQLLGGEPFNKDHFMEILECFEDNKIPFGINTNGVFLKNYFTFISKSNYLKNIFVSIEGPNKEVNDKIRGKNVFSVVDSNLRRLISLTRTKLNRPKVNINMVVQIPNYQHVTEMIKYCVDLGVDSIHFLELVLQGNAQDSEPLNLEQQKEVIKSIIDNYEFAKQNNLELVPKFTRPLMRDFIWLKYGKSFPQAFHPCGAGEGFFYIDNRGQVYPCDRYADVVMKRDKKYSLLSEPFEYIVKQNDFGKVREKLEDSNYCSMLPCSQCKYFGKSCVPCPIIFDKNNYPNMCLKLMDDIHNEIQNICKRNPKIKYVGQKTQLQIDGFTVYIGINDSKIYINERANCILNKIINSNGLSLAELIEDILKHTNDTSTAFYEEEILNTIIYLYINQIVNLEEA